MNYNKQGVWQRRLAPLALGLGVVLALTASALGQSAITALDIGGGVRALAMGEAFIGLADDEQAAIYNPAGLAFIDGIRANANFERHYGTSNYFNLLGGTRSIGASLLLFSMGNIEERDSSDNVVGTFGYSNFSLAASGGLALSSVPLGFTRGLSHFAMGTRLKFISVSSMEGSGGSGFALDLSGLYNATESLQGLGLGGLSLLQFGYSIENLLSLGISYGEGHSERLPFKFKTGLAVKPLEELTLLLDFAVPFELHIGGEYSLNVPAPLSGVDIRAGGALRGGTFAFTAGFGIAYDPLRVDYALTTHPSLPGSHRLAATFRF